MNRRRLLQAFAAATFAAMIEVTGMLPILLAPKPFDVNGLFIADSEKIIGDIYVIAREGGRISALIKKEALPEGMGFHFQ